MSVSNKKNKPSILIVDDERGTREVLAKFLRADYEVTLAEDGEIGLNLLKRNHYDLVLSDIRMPGATGMKILEATLKMTPPPPCILFTAYGSIETAVEAMKHGAFDFVTKPVNFDQLEILIQRALESGRIKEENQELRKRLDSKFGVENIIGNSAAIQRVSAVRSPAPRSSAKGVSSWRTAERCFWMRSVRFRFRRRSSCSVFWRPVLLNESAERRRSPLTHVS